MVWYSDKLDRDSMKLPGRTKRGRPQMRFMDVLGHVGVTKQDARDRARWRQIY